MGRRWPRTRTLGAFAAGLLIASTVAAQTPRLVLRGQRWLPSEVDSARALTHEPAECLTLPTDPILRHSIEIGRAAFRSPLILGGQAARAGLTCETCHRNGRRNPDFAFPRVSGAPGTADVTSSLFSSHRGDGVFNPKPIPDLAMPKAQLKVDQTSPHLETFIHGQVTEEFDGFEIPSAVLRGLADYVRGLSPTACPDTTDQVVGVANLLSDTDRALIAAQRLAAEGDRPAAIAMVAAARARLFLVDERFAAPAPAQDRRALRRLDGTLAQAAQGLRGSTPDAAAGLAKSRKALADLGPRLRRSAPQSLFNPALLRAAMDGRLPRPPS